MEVIMSTRFHCRIPGLLALAACVAASVPATAGTVNINTADAPTIARELKGIGLKRAQAIVDYRAKHGPFKSADELGLVRGIGQKVIQGNRADIRIDAGKAPTSGGGRPAAAPSAPQAQPPATRSGTIPR
jgi:competence protein ComEA